MGQKERDLINERLISLQPHERLFRINAGMGWTGTKITRKGKFLVIENPYPLHAAPEGWPDLCGWTSVVITPDMVGRTVAVFTAEEVKATGRLSKMQVAFRRLMESMGVLYRVRRPDDEGK